MDWMCECGMSFKRLADADQHWEVCEKADTNRKNLNPISPPHYQQHPSGIECIQITEHMNFNLGNATKYIWRAALKGKQIEDLKKARWYLDREIARLERVS